MAIRRSATTPSSAIAGARRWSPETARSTGSACRVSTARRSSRRCSMPSAAGGSGSARRARSERAALPAGHQRARNRLSHRQAASCALRDLMPVTSEEEKRERYLPEHEVLREVEGLRARSRSRSSTSRARDYGAVAPGASLSGERSGSGAKLDGAARSPAAICRSGIARRRMRAHGTARLRAGERTYLSLAYSAERPRWSRCSGRPRARIERSVRWWRDWAAAAPTRDRTATRSCAAPWR